MCPLLYIQSFKKVFLSAQVPLVGVSNFSPLERGCKYPLFGYPIPFGGMSKITRGILQNNKGEQNN